MKWNDVVSLLILFKFPNVDNGDVVLEFCPNRDEVDDVEGIFMRFVRGVISTGADLVVMDSRGWEWLDDDDAAGVSRLTKYNPKQNPHQSNQRFNRRINRKLIFVRFFFHRSLPDESTKDTEIH